MKKSKTRMNAEERRKEFFAQLNVSQATIKNYKFAVDSHFMADCLAEHHVNSLFEMTGLQQLWELYSYINLHPFNVKYHRAFSTAIMKYIRFMNGGEKYGRRIDYRKPKKSKEID